MTSKWIMDIYEMINAKKNLDLEIDKLGKILEEIDSLLRRAALASENPYLYDEIMEEINPKSKNKIQGTSSVEIVDDGYDYVQDDLNFDAEREKKWK
jgi:hypothetical protein